MANTSEYVRYTVYSKRDPSSKSYDIPSYEKDIRNIINNAVKSALPKDTFFQVGDKSLAKSGRASWDIYIHNDNKSVMGKSLSKIQEELRYKGSPAEKYHITKARPVDEEQTKLLRSIEQSLGNKTEPEHVRRNHGVLLKIIALVTTAVDITRRILSSILNFSTQTVKDMTTAHNYGMSYEAVRSYRHVEAQHGLKGGTITDAIADIQNKFGNITNLDEKALEALAVVMGGKIEEMATMGLGSSNPEAILGSILDAFNEKANAGYNSVGQYVGEQQARRELYSYLLKISPQIADIFATMQEEQHNINSIFRGKFDNYEEWKDMQPTKVGGKESYDYNVVVTVGQEWNQVKDVLDRIKENFETSFAPAILGLLRSIKNIRFGMTASENMEVNKRNREENSAEIARVKALLESSPEPMNESEAYYIKALYQYLDELEQANKGDKKGNINNAVRTPDELRVMANQQAWLGKKGGAPSVSMGMNLSKLTGTPEVTIDGILEVLEGYGKFNLEEEKSKYQEELSKANKKIINANTVIGNKALVEAENNIRKLNKERLDKNIAEADETANEAVRKDKNSVFYIPWGAKRLDWVRMGRNLTVAKAEALFGELEGGSVEEKLADGIAKGYIHYANTVTGEKSTVPSINPDKLNKDLVSESEKIAIKKEALLNAPEKLDLLQYDEDDFLYWLYNNNQAWFNENLGNLELDRIKQESVNGNRIASLLLLYTNKTDWLENLPDLAEGMGELYSYNEKGNGGETTHKIILEFGIGADKKQVEVGSFMGEESYEGYLGKFFFTKKNDGTVDYSVSLADSASETKSNSK